MLTQIRSIGDKPALYFLVQEQYCTLRKSTIDYCSPGSVYVYKWFSIISGKQDACPSDTSKQVSKSTARWVRCRSKRYQARAQFGYRLPIAAVVITAVVVLLAIVVAYREYMSERMEDRPAEVTHLGHKPAVLRGLRDPRRHQPIAHRRPDLHRLRRKNEAIISGKQVIHIPASTAVPMPMPCFLGAAGACW